MKEFSRLNLKPLAGAVAASIFALDASMAFGALEEVIVTARKREESLQDVPVVVQAMTAEILEARGTADFQDLNDQVSGLTIYNTGTLNPSINLRGVQSNAVNAASDESVSINLDGIQHSSAQLLRFGLFDLEAVEVLKGPQALFFGKNSPGGIVSMRSKNPTEEFFSEIQVGFEEAAERAYGHVIVSGPFNDTWGGRLAVRYQDADGYFTNEWGKGDPTVTQPFDTTGPDFTEYVTIATLHGEFERGDVTLKVYNGQRDGGAHSWIQMDPCNGDSATYNPFTDCTLNDNVSTAPFWSLPGGLSRLGGTKDQHDYQLTQLSLEANYKINDTWEFTNILGWVDVENFYFGNLGHRTNGIDGFGLGLAVGSEVQIDQLSEEFRFSADFDNFRFMVGAFYDDRELKNPTNVWLAAGAEGIRFDPLGVAGGESWSIFAQTDIDLTEQLELSIGARYTEEERDYRSELTTGPNAGLDGPVLNPELEFTNLSPELTLSWKPAEDLTLFASYKEGFKSGGYNISSGDIQRAALTGVPDENDFKPEDVSGYELGFKWELLDNTLRINGAAFTYNYDDLQLVSIVLVDGFPQPKTVNAASATVEGMEVDFVWATPLPELTVSGNLAYVDAKYEDWLTNCSDFQLFVDMTGCVDQGGGVLGTQRGGDPLRRSPEWAGSLAFSYDAAISETLRFKANLSTSYSGEYQANNNEVEQTIQDSYWVLGANLGIYAADKAWAVDLITRNLTDEAYGLTRAYSSLSNSGGTERSIGNARNAPREIMLQFTFRPDLFL